MAKKLLCLVAIASTVGCMGGGGRVAHNLPPSQRLMEPGPGVGGPGPGVIGPGGGMPASSSMMRAAAMGGPGGPGGPAMCGPGGCPPAMAGRTGMPGPGPMQMGMPPVGPIQRASFKQDAGVQQAQCMSGPQCGMSGPGATSQLAFLGVEGGEVAWDVSGAGMFDSSPLVMPGRQNFNQGGLYRLKLSNLPERPGVELYPTVEVAPVTPRTDAYLAHAPIPIQFTDEDLDQVLSGNFVTKVIYLPDPEFQELALAGVETLVSTRLDPGVDPIDEADRRGSILAIVRIGNLDLQAARGLAGGMVQRAGYMQGCPDGSCMPGGGSPMDGAPMGPVGMNPAGVGPMAVPPHMIAGVNVPQYGMPHVGTPIGLPGPPHIPLGHQAGLTSHTMKNRTRVRMPPPVHKMKINVKQRPGMSYPRPVNNISIDENQRAGTRICGGTVAPAVPTMFQNLKAKMASCRACNDDGCQECQ
ncbi:hypothetical protein [Adhaeretor mobilis]|uniref:hypothetical protein n=1 Tax=Adhaeretor mobilis TaxID=1930276 RepID=UPI00119EBB47|nr:hypothetical protein [Adhaeretor mobilis]